MSIESYFWQSLERSEGQTFRLLPDELAHLFYQHGFVDESRITLEAWLQLLKNFPQYQEKTRITEDNVYQLSEYLYQGKIKKPFDPSKLKEGLRSITWLDELYQKALRFQTTLSSPEWEEKVQNEIVWQFMENKQFVLNENSKKYIQHILDEQPSRLRLLELWVHIAPPWSPKRKEIKNLGPAKTSASTQAIFDSFDAQQKKEKVFKRIEKPFYESLPQNEIDDNEALSFLDELEKLGDSDDSPFS